MSTKMMIVIAISIIILAIVFLTFRKGGFFEQAILPTLCIVIACGFLIFIIYKDDAKKEQIVTVVEKTDHISANANIEIKPVMIRGSLHQPIPDKKIENVMRIYDGEQTYIISVDKETYDQYDVNSKMIVDASDEFKLEIK